MIDSVAFDLDRLVRPHLRQLQPYRSARHAHASASGVLLDANENPQGPTLSGSALMLNRYPDPMQHDLRRRLAELNSVEAESVFVGSGSDEIIDLLLRLFCRPALDAIVICEPTYGMYRVAASIHDVEIISSRLSEGFQLDLPSIIELYERDVPPKLLYCCSPNNPTGNRLSEADVIRLCQRIDSIVVLDEAYVEFSSEGSLAAHVASIPNLVILRTLSKAWGLAGARIGYAVADPEIVDYLLRIKQPYNVGSPSAAIALEALATPDQMYSSVAELIAERERLAVRLEGLSCVQTVYPSETNYLLVRCVDPSALHRQLAASGIIVRDRSSDPGLQGCLRITVGTAAENDLLISTLSKPGRGEE